LWCHFVVAFCGAFVVHLWCSRPGCIRARNSFVVQPSRLQPDKKHLCDAAVPAATSSEGKQARRLHHNSRAVYLPCDVLFVGPFVGPFVRPFVRLFVRLFVVQPSRLQPAPSIYFHPAFNFPQREGKQTPQQAVSRYLLPFDLHGM
jgi:hypothetical protein